jgi:omega-hydroxy-beta-dihydromenaquinone-9 sulfotransferase
MAFRHLQIDRPIFIVGAGRSGTTILYDLLCGHPALGWFSSYTKRTPHMAPLARLNILFKIPKIARKYRQRGWFPRPNEGYPLWDQFHPVANSAGSPPLTENDIAAANIEFMRLTIKRHLRFSNTQRFVNKNTRNTRRARYLHAIFPDAYFIHIIRDGRAVAHSLLNVHFWPSLSLWWRNQYTPMELQSQGEIPLLVAAKNWEAEVKRMLEDAGSLPKEQYTEVRYEDLMNDPKTIIHQLIDFCDLSLTPQFIEYIESFRLENKNFKWTDQYPPDQIQLIENTIRPTLELLGY